MGGANEGWSVDEALTVTAPENAAKRRWWHRWEAVQLTWMGSLIIDPPPPDRFFTRRAAERRHFRARRYGIDGVVRRVR